MPWKSKQAKDDAEVYCLSLNPIFENTYNRISCAYSMNALIILSDIRY